MNNYAVVVIYCPERDTLLKLCDSIIYQGFKLVLVCNSKSEYIDNNTYEHRCHVISLTENRGLAYAQNVGIRYAIAKGAKIISFFDQDSVLSDNLLTILASPVNANEFFVAAPVSINKNNGAEYPSYLLGNFSQPKSVFIKNKKDFVPVDIVISSGTTTTSKVFELVGLFDEDFFIDFIDIEWCLRCRKNKVDIFVIPEAIMEHCIGDKVISLPLVGGVIHSPMRTYYKTRNSFLLLRKDIKLMFTLRQIASALIHNLSFTFYSDKPLLHFRFYVKGILHGIIGKTGKYEGATKNK